MSYVSSMKMHFKIAALGEENTKKFSAFLVYSEHSPGTETILKTMEIKALVKPLMSVTQREIS